VISPRFLGWTDSGSALHRFEVEVYRLRPGVTSNTLVQLGSPETTATVAPYLNNFQYTAPQPGVYAIVVTVYDVANNSARARKIFNYDDQPRFSDTDSPVYFIETAGRNRSYISTVDNTRNLTLNFAGRFEVEAQSQEFSWRVEPWPTDRHSIDDIYGTTFGLRSISAVRGLYTATNMSCICAVDKNNGGRGLDESSLSSPLPDGVFVGKCVTDLKTETAHVHFYSPVRNGETVVVWLKASVYSGLGGTITLKFTSTLDGTVANVTTQLFSHDQYES